MYSANQIAPLLQNTAAGFSSLFPDSVLLQSHCPGGLLCKFHAIHTFWHDRERVQICRHYDMTRALALFA